MTADTRAAFEAHFQLSQRQAKLDNELAQRSWPDDMAHENGNYVCVCRQCVQEFIGHKRRITCKVCAFSRKECA